ncbi:MAG: hypothetical protein H0T78_06645, partial [Longispora sp.]|nr:hypothetical protein [Longispora sp. (in: high G+C Gram-positive bacteria)]
MNRTSVWAGIALGTLTFIVVSFFLIIVAISPSYGCVSPVASASSASGTTSASTAQPILAPIGPWNIQQVANAATIIASGKARGIPARGWVIALATSMQESTLRNLANSDVPLSLALPHQGVGSDHDSVGLFQQRPLPPDGAGTWGTVPELMTPSISAGKFYNAMVRVTNWQTRPVTEVAQIVQRSAFPDAYAKWEPQAAMLAVRLAGVSSIYDLQGASLAVCNEVAVISTGGWTKPVSAKVVSPFGPRSGGYHYGTDLGANRNA